jgi:MFS family permease
VVLTVNLLAVLMTTGALLAPGPAVALAVFFLAGAVLSGSSIGYVNYLLELAPVPQRPAYISLRGTLTAPLLFLGVPGGLLVDRLGYRSVEVIALLGTLAALTAALRLPCLRSPRATA